MNAGTLLLAEPIPANDPEWRRVEPKWCPVEG